jgi:4-hydroxythreonine-4-phosphate dehydrogenase
MGDPGGIGPEVIVKALYCAEIRDFCSPVVIGSAGVMKEAVELACLPLTVVEIPDVSYSKPSIGKIEVCETGHLRSFPKGEPSEESGRVIVEYVKKAVDLALRKEVMAVVTAPVSKESLKMAGHPWRGHTELLAELTGSKTYAMMFISEKLKIILTTIHVPLKEVPGIISEELVFESIHLARMGTDMLGIRTPRIAVSGLNPHAGESGILGSEEKEIIMPSVQKARAQGMSVSGPYPPDVVFYRAYRGDFDIVVCMYHDQGLIPFKMLAFDTGVNVTVGLPVIRTSPDHGTGFDIAWKNLASPSSMIEAVKLASRIKLKVKS